MSQSKLIVWVGGILYMAAFGVFVFLMLKYSAFESKRTREFFEAFDSAAINNRIESTEIYDKGTGIKLDDGRKFVFFPTRRPIFERIAEKGDSVAKKPYADTLFLFQKDRVIRYDFRHFEK